MNNKSSHPNHEQHLLACKGFMRQADILGSKENPGIIPVSNNTWSEGIRSGRYPPGVRISKRNIAWPRHVIAQLCDLLAQGKNWSDRDSQAVKP